MSDVPPTVPVLDHDEIHIWRARWSGGAGEIAFASLLTGYAGSGARPIERGEHGKPRFPPPFDTLGFNWSHSGDTAVLAVGRGPAGFEVGVDVETVRPRARALELAKRFFAPGETAMLEALPEAERLGGFLTLWTAKEAVLKAHGGGLSYGLHRVSFRLSALGAVPDRFDGDVGPASTWCVRPLDQGEGLVSAVAWRGHERSVRVFTFPL
ncbi:4'-phosphopantetheinyl transferase [Luteibacter sp. W1I16]|uniref:4'-phosphopantetheinyl transferase family protein n=1 Tax=Luteibacter sp. W1I16 TaxID=3373922 RepID=UPI003D24E1D5